MLWVMRHRWEHLLFAHWPVETKTMQALLPSGLEPDTFDGWAYLAVVPFQLTFWPRGIPNIPQFGVRFTELNLRTYVRPKGQPTFPAGVYFFSLDASDPFSVEMARLTYHLAYRHAKSCLKWEGDNQFSFHSVRTDSRGKPAEVSIRYRITDQPVLDAEKPLVHFLTDRYRLYAVESNNTLWTAQLEHPPWELKLAEAEWQMNTLPAAHGFLLDPYRPPLLHYSKIMEVKAGLPKRV